MKPRSRVLDPRDKAVLLAIRAYVSLNGFSPSVREICEAVGISSTSAMAWRLDKLERLGKIRRTYGTARSIVVLEDKSSC